MSDATEFGGSESFADAMRGFLAVGHYGHVDQIEARVAWLGGPEVGFVTGTNRTIGGSYAA